jgi:hypothetical protein
MALLRALARAIQFFAADPHGLNISLVSKITKGNGLADMGKQITQAGLIHGILKRKRAVQQHHRNLFAILSQQRRIALDIHINQFKGPKALNTQQGIPCFIAQVAAWF